jgi:hypothetical protein
MSAPQWYETRPNRRAVKEFTFRSQSSPGKIYTTIWYADGATSCNCPGWARRVGPEGERLCVHTRLVKAGNAEADPLYVTDVWPSYPTQDYKTELRTIPKEPQPKPGNGLPRRKFSFE